MHQAGRSINMIFGRMEVLLTQGLDIMVNGPPTFCHVISHSLAFFNFYSTPCELRSCKTH